MQKEKILIGNQYQLRRKIGQGNCGDVYVAVDTKAKIADKLVAVKFARGFRLEDESKRYNAFYKEYQSQHRQTRNTREIKGIPKMLYSGSDFQVFFFIVYDLLGPTLEDLFRFCNSKFTKHTTFQLGLQILDRLRVLHTTGFTHGSIKPQNITMGLESFHATVFLIDFGSLQPIAHPKDHSSTTIWKSVHRYDEQVHTIRDDLVSWLYVLAYFIHGSLIWDLESKVLQKKLESIPNTKEAIWHIKTHDCAKWMQSLHLGPLWNYVGNLDAFEVPNYKRIKDLLLDGIRKCSKEEKQFQFDWDAFRALKSKPK